MLYYILINVNKRRIYYQVLYSMSQIKITFMHRVAEISHIFTHLYIVLMTLFQYTKFDTNYNHPSKLSIIFIKI